MRIPTGKIKRLPPGTKRRQPPVAHPEEIRRVAGELAKPDRCNPDELAEQIRGVIVEHEIGEHVLTFLTALQAASDAYYEWLAENLYRLEGLGTRPSVDGLTSAIDKLLGALDSRTRLRPDGSAPLAASTALRNRLDAALLRLRLSPDQSGNGHVWRDGATFNSIDRIVGDLKGLRKIAMLARTIDGRELQAMARNDLRSAHYPLLRFWTETLGRNGWIGRRGEYSKAVLFLSASLALIDATVSERVIVTFHTKDDAEVD